MQKNYSEEYIGKLVLESIADFFLAEIDRGMASLQAQRKQVMMAQKAAKKRAVNASYRLGKPPISMTRNSFLIKKKQRDIQKKLIDKQANNREKVLKGQLTPDNVITPSY